MDTLEAFEQSKENLQPLRGGRDVSKLGLALRSRTEDTASLEQRLEVERSRCESLLCDYTGNDPLSPWIEYVKWTKNSYPSTSLRSHLVPLLEKCTDHFKEGDLAERYRDDIRLAKLWMMLADLQPDPRDLFAFLEANHIGRSHAFVYVAWASVMELNEDYSMADEVLELGLQRGAQPPSQLQTCLVQLQLRALRRAQAQIMNPVTRESTKPKKKAALGEAGGAKRPKAPAGALGSSQPIASGTQPGFCGILSETAAARAENVQILCDADVEAPPRSTLPPGLPKGAEWARLPGATQRNKENNKAASTWENQALPLPLPLPKKCTTSKESFAVWMDPALENTTSSSLPGHR